MLVSRPKSYKIAYMAVLAALNIVANTFISIPIGGDLQFSVTIFMSILTGIIIGPIFGAVAVFIGDAVGYLVNSWGLMYMPWVGLSCAVMAIIAGFIMNGVKLKFRGAVYVKLAIVSVLVLIVCTVGINTTGFYIFYTKVGFSAKAMGYIADRFGGSVTYWTYLLCRMVFMGQIYNSLFNYALLFAAVPILNSLKPLKIKIQ